MHDFPLVSFGCNIIHSVSQLIQTRLFFGFDFMGFFKLKKLIMFLEYVVNDSPVIHYWPFQCGSFVVVLCCLFWCQSFGDVSPYVCSYCF